MAQSWDELSTDHKIVFLLESLVQKQDPRTPIACRLCDEIFFDNKSLVNHFQSHFHPDGTFNPSSLVRNFASPENEIKLFSSSSQYSHSFSAPVNARNHIANENLGSSNPAKISLGNSLVSTPSKNPLQLRGLTLTHRHQPYPSPSTFRSPKFRFPMKPVTVGKPSQSVPSTSGLTLGKRPQTVMKNEVASPWAGYTKPYITQLEQPIEEMMAGHIDVGGNSNADELDLTLKL